jgi:hypothetical protein
MENENKVPQEILTDIASQVVSKDNLTQTLDTIAYTLWGVIHKLPMVVVKGYVYDIILEGQIELDTDGQQIDDQYYKGFLHDAWFFDEVRSQGLDEDGVDHIFDYYEKWENL